MMSFCECESYVCRHDGTCKDKRRLGLYRLSGTRQTLCGGCAEVAEQFCDAYGYSFEALRETAARRRRAWHAGDWFCAAVLVMTIVWIAFEIMPAFLDGRVAQVV